jgi:hypothetical protein
MSSQSALKSDFYKLDTSFSYEQGDLGNIVSLPITEAALIEQKILDFGSNRGEVISVDFAGPNLKDMPFKVSDTTYALNMSTDESIKASFAPVAKLYSIDRPDQVMEFLFDFEEFSSLLKEIHKNLRKIFKSEILSMFLLDYGRIDAQLIVCVNVTGAVEVEHERMAVFQNDWWFDNFERAGGQIIVDLRFD